MADLERFRQAQQGVYETALGEIQTGRKRSHWMWFIFPQIEGLGQSAMSQKYAIRSLDEAVRYLRDPLLGTRLRDITAALLTHSDKSATDIMGTPDDMKLGSSLTLFHLAAPDDPIFQSALNVFFDGTLDPLTRERVQY